MWVGDGDRETLDEFSPSSPSTVRIARPRPDLEHSTNNPEPVRREVIEKLGLLEDGTRPTHSRCASVSSHPLQHRKSCPALRTLSQGPPHRDRSSPWRTGFRNALKCRNAMSSPGRVHRGGSANRIWSGSSVPPSTPRSRERQERGILPRYRCSCAQSSSMSGEAEFAKLSRTLWPGSRLIQRGRADDPDTRRQGVGISLPGISGISSGC